MKQILIFFCLLLTSCSSNSDWRSASRESANIAPKPEDLNEAIVQIYVARTFHWRGVFAVHPWISWKLKGEEKYTVAQIIGWRVRNAQSSVVVQNDLPDRYWFGSRPELIFDIRGEKAESAISKIKQLIETYPYAMTYRAWPGPNSNSFVAHIIRNTPELDVELPPHAIGKDWLVDSTFLAQTASGTGFQMSAYGLFGLSLGLAEGLEINILGLNFGFDLWTPALKLPLIGRIGMEDQPL